MSASQSMIFIPSVNSSDVMKGDNQSEESMWKGVSGNDSKLSLMARELTQNSIDASKRKIDTKLTKVRFSLKTLDLSFINSNSLLDSIEECLSFNTKENTRARLKKFKTKVENGFGNIQCLLVEDESGGLDGESRFSGGLMNILAENYSEKSSSDLGSFGVGKTTALYISSFGTVFYLNQRDGKQSFIGKTKLSGYKKKNEERAFFGPNLFCGLPTKNRNEKVADWSSVKPELNLRTFENDGLTTIIPVDLEELDYSNLDWKEVCAVSCIKSYFKNFEDNTLELEFIDGENPPYIINHSNYKVEFKRLSETIISSEAEVLFIHRILISKPYILGEEPKAVADEKLSLKLTKTSTGEEEKYSSNLKISFYENTELENFLDETPGLSKNETYNFRILRGEILVRNFAFPHYKRFKRLDSNMYCGIIELSSSGDDGCCISELIRLMETQSHDSLDLEQLRKTFNKEATSIFNDKVLKVINRVIVNTIEDLVVEEKKNLEKINIELNLGGQLDGANSGDGYYREIKRIDSLPSPKDKPDGAYSMTADGDVKKPGDAGDGQDETEQPDGVSPNNSSGGNIGGLQGGTGTKRPDGSSIVKDKKAAKNIKIRSKRTYKKGKKAKYQVLCTGIEKPSEVQLYQNSIEGYKNSIRMFELLSVKVNSKELKLNSIVQTPKHVGIPIKETEKKEYLLDIEVNEPEHSITEFFVKVV